MYGIVVMAALAGGCSWGECDNGFGPYSGGCLGPCLPTGPNSGGRFHIGLFEGWGAQGALSADEKKQWTDYIEQLDGPDRQNLERIWQSADPDARKKILQRLSEAQKRWEGKGGE